MPRTKKAYSPKHITRVDTDSNGTHAWRVTIQRRNEIVVRPFSDGVHGGKAKALKAAQAFRDEMLGEMHSPDFVVWRRNRKRVNNTSGVVGVGRYVSRHVHEGRVIERPSWQAFWTDESGRRVSRKFSVAVHGEKQARLLAIECRRRGTRAAVEAMFDRSRPQR